MLKTLGYEYRCDSNPLIFKVHTYCLTYVAAFFTTLLVEQIEQITYAYTHIRIYAKNCPCWENIYFITAQSMLYILLFVTYIFDSVCDA